jgi:hypothetical protein
MQYKKGTIAAVKAYQAFVATSPTPDAVKTGLAGLNAALAAIYNLPTPTLKFGSSMQYTSVNGTFLGSNPSLADYLTLFANARGKHGVQANRWVSSLLRKAWPTLAASRV